VRAVDKALIEALLEELVFSGLEAFAKTNCFHRGFNIAKSE
jgi:hypothetical protein